MSLSQNIRKYRIEKGYTQEQLAAILDISAQAVSKWETSDTYPDGSLLIPLSKCHHLKPCVQSCSCTSKKAVVYLKAPC